MVVQDAEKDKTSYLDWALAGHSAIWRYVVALPIALVLWVIGGVPVITAFGAFGIDVMGNAAAMSFTFIVGYVGVLLLTCFLLERPGWSVALPAWPPVWRDFGFGVALQWGVLAALYIVSVDMEYVGAPALDLALVGFAIALVAGLLVQTGFEELLFRGLFMQTMRRFTTWAPDLIAVPVMIGTPALVFASMHTGNITAWSETGLAVLPYIAPALAWGWIAWRHGSILIPMALHFANNAFLFFFVGTAGDAQSGIAPFVAPTPGMERAVLFALAQNGLLVLGSEIYLRCKRLKDS